MSQTASSDTSFRPLTHPKIGILGDGQLARMLIQEAAKLGIKTEVLSQSKDSPAAQVTSSYELSSQTSPTQFEDFASTKDLLTIESEFLDPKILSELSRPVFPQPEILQQIRDRLPQKKSLLANKISTSPLHEFKTKQEILDFFKTQSTQGLVFKKRLFGYDGYGTQIIKNLAQAQNFCQMQNLNLQDWIAEDFIPFTKELAISFARNANGQICEFPLVETYQKNSKCLWVKGPVEKNPYQKFFESLKAYLNKLNYIGLITFELFLDANKQVSVNEIAPRIHNSGHYSLNAMSLNQFKAHLFAICNFDLPEFSLSKTAFAMYNLIGENQKETCEAKLDFKSFDIYLHWYGKGQCRPGRKMGHLTALDSSADQALERLKKARKEFSL